MKLYNTLTRTVEEVVSFTGKTAKKLGLYACGPTVYDYTHLGHLRKYTMDDVLVRALRHPDIGNFSVNFVQNITDVGHLTSDGDTGEDKLEKGAKKYNKTVWEIAQEFEEYYWKSMKAMGNLAPDTSCRATDHISEQLDMVKTLERKGFTYVIEGDGVYFDTSKFPAYGQMAHLKLAEQQAGARIDMVEGKRHPTDFALWKFERPGENRAMVWQSPWAERSFPGWHIECSAMACHYLGEQFEVHTGGIDHIPVHHTNEIAQAEAAFGKSPFVKYWVHHNFLRIEGEKMSKSLGNVFTIDDITERGFDPMALRLLFLTTHYRSELNFTWNNLEGSQKAYERLANVYRECYFHNDQKASTWSFITSLNKRAVKYKDEFTLAIADDLNTAQAVAIVWALVKDHSLNFEEKQGLLEYTNAILGLQLFEKAMMWPSALDSVSDDVQDLLDRRDRARKKKQWSISDSLRQEISDRGFELEDTADGQKITKKPQSIPSSRNEK